MFKFKKFKYLTNLHPCSHGNNINKSLTTLGICKVPKLGRDWKEHIPKHPDFPDGYFEQQETTKEPEEQETSDVDEGAEKEQASQ